MLWWVHFVWKQQKAGLNDLKLKVLWNQADYQGRFLATSDGWLYNVMGRANLGRLSSSTWQRKQGVCVSGGGSFPFKISSQDLTGCHYCSALLDGSADEWAIAVCNRHEKVDEMEVWDTWPLKDNDKGRSRNEMRSHPPPKKMSNVFLCTLTGTQLINKTFPHYSKKWGDNNDWRYFLMRNIIPLWTW